jgi:hypothetical protein
MIHPVVNDTVSPLTADPCTSDILVTVSADSGYHVLPALSSLFRLFTLLGLLRFLDHLGDLQKRPFLKSCCDCLDGGERPGIA